MATEIKRLEESSLPWAEVKETENSSCIFGCTDAPQPLQEIKINNLQYYILKCPNDGLMFLSPQPGEASLQEMYQDKYFLWLYSNRDGRVDDSHRQKDAELRVHELEHYCPRKGRLLEVGCGFGYVLQEAKSTGWQVTGIEYSQFAAKIASSKQLAISRGSLLNLPCESNTFDTISFYNVLEHVANPLIALCEARRVVNNNGVVIIRTPETNPSGPELYAIDHLWHFTQQNIFQMLQRSGLLCIDYYESGILKSEKLSGTIKSVTVICKPAISK